MNEQASITYFTSGSFVIDDMSLSYIGDNRQRIVQLSFARDHHDKGKKDILSSNSAIVFRQDLEFDDHVQKTIERYLKGQEKHIPLQTASFFVERGTDLQRKIWQLISGIEYGRTKTYGDLARELGNRRLARAVGQACHVNPLALIVPCHRVVGAAGVGGFAAEGNIKSRLLALEKKNR